MGTSYAKSIFGICVELLSWGLRLLCWLKEHGVFEQVLRKNGLTYLKNLNGVHSQSFQTSYDCARTHLEQVTNECGTDGKGVESGKCDISVVLEVHYTEITVTYIFYLLDPNSIPHQKSLADRKQTIRQ